MAYKIELFSDGIRIPEKERDLINVGEAARKELFQGLHVWEILQFRFDVLDNKEY